MSTVREYRTPLAIVAATLVAVLLLWTLLVSPQKTKLSSLQTQQTQLQTQQTSLQEKLTTLKSEQQQLPSKCADLQKIATQIPSVQSPTDVDAEESSFESQFNGLAGSTGVTLNQFSGFAPASPTSSAPAAAPASKSADGVVAVPTTLAVTGTYGQMLSFVNGLDSFPRLFVIQNFQLAFGTGAGSSSTSGASTAPSAGATATPLWTGGTATSPSATPYSLSITGSIYYTTTPNALESCTKATSATS
jgi:Tfp pilus assembly protein PilO